MEDLLSDTMVIGAVDLTGKKPSLKNIVLSEISQSQKTKGQMFSLLCGCWFIMGRGWMEELWIGQRRVKEGKGVGGGKDDGMRLTSLT